MTSPKEFLRGASVLLAVMLIATGSAGASDWVQRVNVAGGAYVDYYGNTFAADQPYAPGGWGYMDGRTASTSNPVHGTTDDVLYQSARGQATFKYLFDDMPNGTYEVRLYFNEWWNDTAGQRIFNVFAENNLMLFRYDPFRYCGAPDAGALTGVGSNRACVQIFEVAVADGQLELRWNKAFDSISLPMVSAIEVERMHELA